MKGSVPVATILLLAAALPLFLPGSTVSAQLPVERLWGGASDDTASDMAHDSLGDLYITGTTSSFGTGQRNAFLVKFDSMGNLLWQRTWGGSDYEYGKAVTVDNDGYVYVAGDTVSFGLGGGDCAWTRPGCPDIFLLKFSSTGSLEWESTWGGNSTDEALSVDIDVSGNLYVAGLTNSFSSGSACPLDPVCFDAFLLKFNSSASLVWALVWGEVNQFDAGEAVEVDSLGYVYVTGRVHGDIYLAKFAENGTVIWQRTWGDSEGDVGHALAISPTDDIYVAGGSQNPDQLTEANAILTKISPSGSLAWHRTWGGRGEHDDEIGLNLGVDASGDIYMTGYVDNSVSVSSDVFLLSFDASGGLISQRIWGTNSQDAGTGITIISSDAVFLTGYVDSAPPYRLRSSNLPIYEASLTTSTPELTPVFIEATITSPRGNLSTPSSSGTYSGRMDVFLMTIAESSSIFDPIVIVWILIPAVVVILVIVRQHQISSRKRETGRGKFPV